MKQKRARSPLAHSARQSTLFALVSVTRPPELSYTPIQKMVERSSSPMGTRRFGDGCKTSTAVALKRFLRVR
jgi:hypothetical protein